MRRSNGFGFDGLSVAAAVFGDFVTVVLWLAAAVGMEAVNVQESDAAGAEEPELDAFVVNTIFELAADDVAELMRIACRTDDYVLDYKFDRQHFRASLQRLRICYEGLKRYRASAANTLRASGTLKQFFF